jgi:glycerophosphoryl diester phosphodiesterase
VNIPYFRGVFMRNSLPQKIENKECGIVNLDSINGPGTHWVAYYRNGNSRIYFDSFGLDAPKELQKYLGKPYKYQTFQLQDATDSICGHLCLHVLSELCNGNTFKNIILQLI